MAATAGQRASITESLTGFLQGLIWVLGKEEAVGDACSRTHELPEAQLLLLWSAADA